MFQHVPFHLTLAALALALIASAASAGHATFWDWDVPYHVKEDEATWAAYYKKNARVELGREQRLPNGVSWRLHLDVGTGLAMPRITWMPDLRRVRTANDILDRSRAASCCSPARLVASLNWGTRSRGLRDGLRSSTIIL